MRLKGSAYLLNKALVSAEALFPLKEDKFFTSIEMGAYDMKDHTGKRLNHGKAWVNDVYIHYATGGSGPLVVLLHGVPKSMFFWRHVIPLLTPHYTVLAADLRGFGDSERPATGYDTGTLAEDIAAAVASLGYKSFRLVGEDWGAAVAYVIAARYPERVEQLVFEEMLLPGLGWVSGSRTEGGSGMKKLKNWDTRRLWHKEFFSVPGYPEMLIPGQLRPFWSMLLRAALWLIARRLRSAVSMSTS